MKLLVLQHIACEHPVSLRRFLDRDGVEWDAVELDDAVVLASSDVCTIQAMRVGNNAWSMQYHVEAEANTVDDWAAIPAYRQALIGTLGEPAIAVMQQDANAAMGEFLASAEILYNNFMAQLS